MRYYSSTATPKTLAGAIANGTATSMTVNNVAGLPTLFPYTLVIDSDLATEEIVSVTAAAGNTLTIVRGQDGTTGTAHALGAAVRHMVTARDLQEPQNHMNTGVAVHGISGSVVGTTDTQTLTNKTISGSTNTLSNIAQSAVTNLSTDLAGKAALASPTFTGTPAAPTAAADTNTTQVATTAFVLGQGSVTAPIGDGTAAAGTSSRFARADHVHPVATHTHNAGPMCYMYNPSFSISTSSTYMPVLMSTEVIDSANGHSTSTNTDRYTATVAGYYLVSAQGTYYNTVTASTTCAVYISKNNSTINQIASVSKVGVSTYAPLHTSWIVYLNGTTDFINFQALSTANDGVLINAAMHITFLGA